LKKVLFIFLDGVGLGSEDPSINPFAKADTPTLISLLDGHRLIHYSTLIETKSASLVSLDACLGVAGLPQSATGQATLLCGANIPESLGYHYGPKPNQKIRDWLKNENLFSRLTKSGLSAALLNAYPPSYFESIRSGRRLYATIPQAVVFAGIELRTAEDLNQGKAISADFTAQGWHSHLKLDGTPILTPFQAGERLSALAKKNDFSFFEFWISDYVGHSQDMEGACEILKTIDLVLTGLLSNWSDRDGIILLTSDHGNVEDLSTRRHTKNPVPALLIGHPEIRQEFNSNLHNLMDVSPAIHKYLIDSS